MRKIIHLDMDAFYASVEQRDRPELRGQPVVVGWQAKRGVVCAASYEARKFGVRSAMPVAKAQRLCPDAVFVPPDFTRYRAVSQQIGEIFRHYTPLVEPLSLDEAYLDVTANQRGLPSATATAEAIRADIRQQTGLTASAGVASNKFLAKIASDWRKPDGLFVIRPHEAHAFLAPLPVNRLPGVGQATERALDAMGISTIAELRAVPLSELARRFGRNGARLHELAFGIDEREVVPERPRRSISTEETFEGDLTLAEVAPSLPRMLDEVWAAARKHDCAPRTLVVKLKTSDFRTLTRSVTPSQPPGSAEDLLPLLPAMLARFEPRQHYRLAGVGLANFIEPDEAQTDFGF